MKNFLLIICNALLLLVLSACSGALSNFSNKPLQVSENLPKIEKLKHISDMTSIAFEWDSKYDEAIQGFFLYRSDENDPEMKIVATIKDKYQTHFVDKNLEPDTKYFYMMKSYNDLGYVSEDGVVVEGKTAKRIVAMPFVESIQGLPYKIKLIWRPHPDIRVASYVVERANADGNFKFLAEVKSRLSAEYIDSDLRANQNFQYRIFAKTFDGVYSESSEILNATTKALPPSVEQVLASTNIARKIILTWDSIDFEDFAYYKVYASSSNFLPYTALAKVQANSYEDLLNEDGQTRSYKITIVDKDGLESPMSKNAALGKTLEAPKNPSIISANLTQNGLVLEWKSNDDRAVQYMVKRYGGGADMVFREITETTLTDSSVVFGQKYSYEVIAIDSNDLESKPSAKISVAVEQNF